MIGRRTFTAGIAVALVSLSGRSFAQSDFLGKAKGLLGTMGSDSGGGSGSGLSQVEIGSGLKEALRIGSERVVSQLGVTDGFNADPEIHIPLPGVLKSVQSALDAVGQGELLNDLELRLNRAAEIATPKAKDLFWQSIEEMTLDDARGILEGPDDSATRYFQRKMTPGLVEEMTPIVDESIADAGAIQSYDKAMERYKSIPFVPDAKANLTEYVVEKGMDGIFYYLAREEAAIRQNPAARTTDLLRKVFG